MPDKVIEIQFGDGSEWQLPAHIVAHKYAAYHSERDFRDGDVDDQEKAYAEEYEFMLTDESYMLDWFSNHMNWNEFADQLVQVSPPKPDYESSWVNADKRLIEKKG